MSNASLYISLLGLIVLIIVINMVRTRRLQERYALLWLLAGVGLMIAPLFIPVLDQLAYAMGFAYTPALLLMLAVVGLLLLIFQLSLSLTRTGEQLKIVTQELGLLRHEVEKLARQAEKELGPVFPLRGTQSANRVGHGQETDPSVMTSGEERIEHDGEPT